MKKIIQREGEKTNGITHKRCINSDAETICKLFFPLALSQRLVLFSK